MTELRLTGFLEPLLAYLEGSTDTAIALLDRDLLIQSCNSCFQQVFIGPGHDLGALLSGHERRLLSLEDGEEESMWLVIKPEGLSGTVFRGNAYRRGDAILLVGSVRKTGDDDVIKRITLLANEMTNISRDLKRKNRELREARSQIETLSGIIPICMYCKEIRNDEGYWDNLETFISEHSEAEFSHSICSKCAEKYFPGDET